MMKSLKAGCKGVGNLQEIEVLLHNGDDTRSSPFFFFFFLLLNNCYLMSLPFGIGRLPIQGNKTIYTAYTCMIVCSKECVVAMHHIWLHG
jgi:hypothetical protein